MKKWYKKLNKSQKKAFYSLTIMCLIFFFIIPLFSGLFFGLSTLNMQQAAITADRDLLYYLNVGTTNGGKPIKNTITYQYIDVNDNNKKKSFIWSKDFDMLDPIEGDKTPSYRSSIYNLGGSDRLIYFGIDYQNPNRNGNPKVVIKNKWNNYTVRFYFNNFYSGVLGKYIEINVYRKNKSRCYQKNYLFIDDYSY